MSVRTRLVVAFIAVSAVLAVPSLWAVVRLTELRRIAVEGRTGQAAAVAGIGRMHALVSELDRLERSYIATSDAVLGELAATAADSLLSERDALARSSYGDLAGALGDRVSDVATRARDVERHVAAGRVEDAAASFALMLEAFAAVERELGVLADSIDARARADLEEARAITASARSQTVGGLVLTLLLALGVSAATTGALIGPLRRLGRAMARVADGDFSPPRDLPYQRRDELGELASSFGTMATRLAELDRVKSEFMGMVSHELKTPINVINAYAELLEDELGPRAPAAQRRMLALMNEQAKVMLRLVSRLMDISRLEAGTYRLALEPVSIADLCTDASLRFRELAAEKDIDFEVRVSSRAPQMAILDVDIVRDEILGNLVLNALRFTPQGGRVELAVDGGEGAVVFTVADSGPGVAPQHRDLIFRKHYVADRTRAIGSGLGLAIAKEMVELHGGLITLERVSPLPGACFRVALPTVPVSVDLEVPSHELLATREREAARRSLPATTGRSGLRAAAGRRTRRMQRRWNVWTRRMARQAARAVRSGAAARAAKVEERG